MATASTGTEGGRNASNQRPWWRGPIDLRKLYYFVQVARKGSFHRASHSLNVAQPVLSRQVGFLEQELDVQLLVRSTKGVRLTAPGEVLVEEVEKILPLIEQAIERTRRAQAGQFGRLRVAFAPVIADSRFAVAAYAEARRTRPDLIFKLDVLSSETQMERLESGEIDLGILYRRGPLPSSVHYRDLRADRYMLAVSRDHPLTRQKNLTMADLEGEEFVFAPRNSLPVTYSEMMLMAQQAGLRPNIAFEAPNESVFLNLVAEGLAIGFANASLNERRPNEDVAYLEVEGLDVSLNIAALWCKDRESEAVVHFVEQLVKQMNRGAA